MRQLICFIIFFPTGFYILSAQQLSPVVITTDGGSGTAPGIQLDWTIGEPAIESFTDTLNGYTEGFHQPMLLVEKGISADKEFPEVDPKSIADLIDIQVAPNPVAAHLVITIPTGGLQPDFLHVFRQDGTTVMTRKIDVNEVRIDLDMSTLVSGIYLLRFVSIDGHAISTFKISKIQ